MKNVKKAATRITAIDFGLVRLGIAISDESKLIALPLPTLKAEKRSEMTAAKIMEALKQHQQQHAYELLEIVIGMPLLMSGKRGLLADEVEHFITLLNRLSDLPIQRWDERLTSVQADRSLREAQLSRKKRAQHSDSVAAVIILQNYLDYRIRDL